MSRHHSERMSGGARQKRNRALLARLGDVCHICGHEGADALDHLQALARGGADDETNLLPAHQQPCPTCGERCNLRKGDRKWAPIIRHSGSLNRP